MIVGPPNAMPMPPGRGARAFAISSLNTNCCITVIPAPPYSFGHAGAVHPFAASFFIHPLYAPKRSTPPRDTSSFARIVTCRAERPPSFEYLHQLVEPAEQPGYFSLLIPARFSDGLCEESPPLGETWPTVTALAAVTSRIRFLAAVRPGFISAGLF